ncbi:MAG: hypothetical protein U0136_06945 [Bdellovibrionota bacterium]
MRDSIRKFLRVVFIEGVDPRIIYLFVLAALTIPLVAEVKLPPAPMTAAEDVFKLIDGLKPEPGKIVVIAADWGPGTSAENGPQTRLVIEHLMRKRIPFALMTLYQLAPPFLKEVPLEVAASLTKEMPGQTWEYGKDWVNLGFQVNGQLSLQSLARAADMQLVQKDDAFGAPLADIPVMKDVHTIKDVQALVQVTGLVGVFNIWLQFFRSESYAPPMVHGCTSITIPDAYMYYSSKQIRGFFEGVAGAAWYDKLLDRQYPDRKDVAVGVNTGLAVAQLVILAFILVGNIGYLCAKRL